MFESAYEPDSKLMGSHLSRHGDGVHDVAFSVEDIDTIVKVNLEKNHALAKRK